MRRRDPELVQKLGQACLNRRDVVVLGDAHCGPPSWYQPPRVGVDLRMVRHWRMLDRLFPLFLMSFRACSSPGSNPRVATKRFPWTACFRESDRAARCDRDLSAEAYC